MNSSARERPSTPRYRRRILDNRLDDYLVGLPAIAIEGIRGVGKTATASQRADHTLRLDDPAVRALIEADPKQVHRGAGTILIDEWQQIPSVWDLVRRAVDDGAPPGRFLLTGSSAPVTAPVHTGAGRIVSLRLRPMSLMERGVAEPTVSLSDLLKASTDVEGECDVSLARYVAEIQASGLPGVRRLPSELREVQLSAYLDYALNHDVVLQAGSVRRPEALRHWFNAYAAATATTASWNAILDAATAGDSDKPARSTVEGYRAALARLWLLDPVPAWIPRDNPLERLTQAPKHHLADPALAVAALGLGNSLLRTTPPGPSSMLGALFESLVTQSIRTYAEASGARIGHLRTMGSQREIDLIVEARDGQVAAIEVKLSQTVTDHDVGHLHWLGSQLGTRLAAKVVVTTGVHAYRRGDDVLVIPAALLGP